MGEYAQELVATTALLLAAIGAVGVVYHVVVVCRMLTERRRNR